MAKYLDKDGVIYLWSKIKSGFVTKDGNKVLSDNNYTTTEKNKLAGLSNYTHPSTHPASIIVQDSSNRFVSDTEKSTWNAKAGTSVASSSANGLMSSTMFSKLNGIEAGANKYTHPSTHPASIIAQDSSNRFVTDAEKSTWNAKAESSVATSSANGLMSSSDKAKLDAFGSASTYALKSDIVGMYKYKGSISGAGSLPANPSTGDVYNIESASQYGGAGTNVAWNGTAWDSLGSIFTLDAITNAEIDVICV